MHPNNISHKYIRLLAFMGRQAAERSTVVATAADMAQAIFDRITSGAGNAVGWPAVIDKSNSTIDRALRELVEQANRNGDCIINAGEGYFRPIPGNVVDEYYFHEYMAKEKSRLKELDKKIGAMETTYEMWKKEAMSEEERLWRKDITG